MTEIFTFTLASIAVAVTPGPSWIYVLSRSLAQGRTAGLVAVAGNTTGIAVHAVMVSLGLSVMIAQSSVLFNGLKIVGVIYLLYLGVRTLMTGYRLELQRAAAKRLRILFVEAVLVNVTNPKVALLFLALLPQFVPPGMAGAEWRIFGFGFIHMAVATAVTLVLVVAARRLDRLFDESSIFPKLLQWGAGSALVVIAGRLAFVGRQTG